MNLPDDPVWIWLNNTLNRAFNSTFIIFHYRIHEVAHLETTYFSRANPVISPATFSYFEVSYQDTTTKKCSKCLLAFDHGRSITIFVPNNNNVRLQKWTRNLGLFKTVDILSYIESWYHNSFLPPLEVRKRIVTECMEVMEHVNQHFQRATHGYMLWEFYDNEIKKAVYSDVINNKKQQEMLRSRLVGLCNRAIK